MGENMFKECVPFWKYEMRKATLYFLLLPISYGIFAALIYYAPNVIIFATGVIKPVTGWVAEQFMSLVWNLAVPDSVHHGVSWLDRHVGFIMKPIAQGTSWLARQAIDALPAQAKAAFSLAFGGFILVTLLPRLLRLPVMWWCYRGLERDILHRLTDQQLTEELERRQKM